VGLILTAGRTFVKNRWHRPRRRAYLVEQRRTGQQRVKAAALAVVLAALRLR
jgi:hypothetical protein